MSESWEEQLFAVLDDLEGQAESAFALERDLELPDRSASEYAQVSLASRLMASLGHEVALDVRGIGVVRGELRRVSGGPDDVWALVEPPGQEWVIRLAHVLALRGASPRSTPEAAWSPLTKLGFASTLRRIAAARGEAVLHLDDGARHDVTLVRVGADFVEAITVRQVPVLVPFAAIAAVARRE